MPLTDITVRNAKGRTAAYKLADSGGLYVLVRPNGARYWRMDTAGKESARHLRLASIQPFRCWKREKNGTKRKSVSRTGSILACTEGASGLRPPLRLTTRSGWFLRSGSRRSRERAAQAQP